VRHSNGNRKLSKPTDQRMAMLYSIVTSLFEHGKIQTTVMRAKEARKIVDKVVTWSKAGDVPARRRVYSMLKDRTLIKRLFSELPVRYEGRAGGYTRITKIISHKGDNAPMALLELV
jgi:large subunit ribosomal protein L17